MLISAVMLILQETLEAAMLLSLLLALIKLERLSGIKWGYFILLGLIGAMGYSLFMGEISMWFDYVGQEVINALLHFTIVLAILILLINIHTKSKRSHLALNFTIGLVLICAITREGSEIILYLSGIIHEKRNIAAIILGSFIGLAIGISTATLFFYLILSLPQRTRNWACLIFMSLFCANMASQGILAFIQADWIESTQPIWDTSNWLSENSILGRLLYAFIGYEATPTIHQLLIYISIFLITSALTFKKFFNGHQLKV